MTKVEALKKLFETLGGDPDEVVNETQIAAMIDKLCDVAEGGGGGGFAHYLQIDGTYSGSFYFTLLNKSDEPITSEEELSEAIKDKHIISATGWYNDGDFGYLVVGVFGDAQQGIQVQTAYCTEEETFAFDHKTANDIAEITDTVVAL